MRAFSYLIKPAAGLCNLHCRYCFYADETKLRKQANLQIMNRKTVDILLSRALEPLKNGDQVTFAFQGGEPTLAGADFFEYFCSQANKYKERGIGIKYTLQTNGTLLNDKWIRLFRSEDFLVGLSLDGTRYIHDLYRHDKSGKGTWERICNNLNLLRNAAIDVNLLCVLTKQAAAVPQDLYASLKSLHVPFLQFIPCLDPLETARGSMPYSLLPQEYGKFLCDLFDVWYRDWEKGECISIRLFEDYLCLLLGLTPTTCATNGACGIYFVIEADGSVYPCDFFALDTWSLGNIHSNSIAELLQSEAAKKFMLAAYKRPQVCKSCKWRKLCRGGCMRDRVRVGTAATDQDEHSAGDEENYYCEAFRTFFAYAESRLCYMADCLRHARNSEFQHPNHGSAY